MMSVTRSLRFAFGLFVTIGSLPPTILHELTHLAFAAPFTRESVVTGPTTEVHWRADAPRWGIALASLAPVLVGTTVALVALAWMWTTPGPVAETATDWLALSIAVVWWGTYVSPSGGDLEGVFSTVGGERRGDK